MNEYTIGLALYDYLPSVFTALALYYVVRMTRHAGGVFTPMTAVGALLIVAAGVSKATWKLNMAAFAVDSTVLREALFVLMAPGFALVAVATWGAMRHAHDRRAPGWLWVPTAVVIALTYGWGLYQWQGVGVERGWFQPLLNLASVANLTLTVLLVREAAQRRMWGTIALLLVNFGMIFALIPIANMETQSIAVHWFEQTLTSAGAGAFALAGWQLYRIVSAEPRPTRTLAATSYA